MDLRSLRYFIHAVELGSITAAAEACHVAQPSITHAIAQLEQEFETTFLIRSRKGVTPTEKGVDFYEKAKSLLQHAQFIEEEVRKDKCTSELLYVHPSINALTLSESMSTLKETLSGTQWRLTPESKQANYWLSNEHDITAEQKRKGNWQPLITEHYYLLVPQGHETLSLKAHQQDITIQRLLSYDWIERSHCPFKKAFDDLLHQMNIYDQIRIQASVINDDWAISLVASGYGITIAPVNPSNLNGAIRAIPLSDIQGAPTVERTIGLLEVG